MELNATFIGQALAFLIFVVLCMKFIWPPVMTAIDARRKEIEDGLTAAERSKKDLELAQNRASEELKAAKKQPRLLSRPTAAELKSLTAPRKRATRPRRRSLPTEGPRSRPSAAGRRSS